MSEEQNIEEHSTDDNSQSIKNENIFQENIEPQTKNYQPQTENMEVHKHPHHVTHKKKWTEYLLEFFMLFLAVFLGFIAENVRETITEKEKEKQYMESFLRDLENDTLNLNVGFPLKEQRLMAIDSVFSFFELNPRAEAVPGVVVHQMYRTNWDKHYRRNSTTIDQLRNAGGMRLIRKKNVADSIAAYDFQWQRAEYWREAYIIMQQKAMNLLHQIFNAVDLVPLYKSQNTGSPLIPPNAYSLNIRIYSAPLNEYLNFLYDQKITTRQDTRAYMALKRSAEKLIELIKKEYNIK